MPTIKDAIRDNTNTLMASGFESARLDVEVILSHMLETSREGLLIHSNKDLSPDIEFKLQNLIQRRLRGEPVAYITGTKSFFGLDFLVSPGVLVPRPETEHLVEEALQWLALHEQEQLRICDMGTGSGCIGLSILKNTLASKLIAIDISDAALVNTLANAQRLSLGAQVELLKLDLNTASDLKTHVSEPVDLVVANPPYIAHNDIHIQKSVRDHEPLEALYAGQTGYECIAQWKNAARQILKPGGLLIMEFGFLQGFNTHEIFKSDLAYESVRIGKDLSGNNRYIVATRTALEG